MKARDVMVSPVITAKPSSTIKEVAKLLLDRGISAVPVVDESGKLVGIVSEGDLMRRAEIGTQPRHSWWLRVLSGDNALANQYVKAHARTVADVMTRDVIAVSPDTPLHEIAGLLERRSIKRVPIVKGDKLVGIVSRANLLQALASSRQDEEVPGSDGAIRERILANLNDQPWAHTLLLNVTVNGGVVDLWGITGSDAETKAIRVAAESTPGVTAVNDHLVRRTAGGWP
ncbi:MAG TPA: CBS domain-containing protein [Xanthobacteraceae bacterium]|jgi:CBS domain-containing protein